MKALLASSLFVASFLVASCQSAKYAAYERLGVEKRELLKKDVKSVQNQQKENQEDFKDALEQLRKLYGSKGSELEKRYDSIKSEYDDAKSGADTLTNRVEEMDRVAKDLFKEWEGETDQLTTAALKRDSLNKLRETEKRYQVLSRDVHGSEKKMRVVLSKLGEQVIYLKHNLNAESIGTLSSEKSAIEKDINELIGQMEKSIASSEEFNKHLSN